ncbi:hypothetical protein [Fimbriimonas ginsengisoli]|uniref:Rhamnogalacturonan lyase domain-containing protein n=1 Tax=Fimbriimonas ginsengisoli Gsoil 348 TaxID=661478 RepID=A0A068NL06_FIMGI|nr:hypothetical protein [Fimbriimonas ginsengisoli]AIE84087.1 hypothetical protein OP10G_0719 [Fimbriimonas ginsengisoli Gsoil 348]
MLSIFVAAIVAGLPTAELSGDVRLANGRPAKDAIVWFEAPGAKSTPMKRQKIDQRDMRFSPHVLAVTVDTWVDFPNNDTVFHNVFSEYHSQRFDFGMYPKGQTKSQKFDRAGVAVLLCTIHPQMSAYVVCVDTPYFAKADARGRFHIANVPTGEYRVKVWHESGEELSQSIAVNGVDPIRLQIHRRR